MFLSGCRTATDQSITFVGGTSRWIFSNGIVSVVVKPAQGIYEIWRTGSRRDAYMRLPQKMVVSEAYLRIDKDSTNEPGRSFDHSLSDFMHGGESGKYLTVTSSMEGRPGLGVRFGLLPGRDFVVIDGGIMNTGTDVMQVREISVLTGGLLYGGRKLTPGFRMLDGNGGGEDTRVTQKPEMECRNNFLLTWGKPDRREVLVAGGITYTEIEKFVHIVPVGASRRAPVDVPVGAHRVRPGKAVNVESVEPVEPVEMVGVRSGNPYRWETGYGKKYDEILYDKEAIVLGISGLKMGKDYVLNLAWSDDADTRKQSVAWEGIDGVLHTLLEPRKLPSHGAGEAPEEIRFNLPAGAVTGDTLKIHIRNEGGINAVVCDVSVTEGNVKESLSGVAKPVDAAVSEPENLRMNLYAQDPVGKRVDPGKSWFPEDAFYVSVGHNNPFEALEQYGDVLKDFQNIDLEYYTFPTVCLWYAQHKGYGDGPAVNDAPGAVAEMDRAVKSGFLRYVPVSIRLVPDAYEENNEQGWWDEKHWQMYGTGKFANPPDGNVDVAPGHYKKPYETTAKWAQAIIDRGGIPLTYFQTGRRSDDYAEAFPEHMLWNRSDATVPDQDWMKKGKGSYDFTDPGFQAHMREVYKNLHDGGVKGLMYDYPYTGWAAFGGMEDVYSTTASAYRTVFQLARTGLGPEAFLDERNLDHGSDITLGIVSSQRIWGDTDRMSPLMISRGALRWYKNRKVVSYDMDAKNLLKAQPAGSDGVRKLLTLMYTTCGRFLMANSFDRLSPELVHDLSRIFPYPDSWISARPVDAFSSKYPEIFVFRVQPGWYQMVVYNPNDQHPAIKTIRFDSPDYFGALDLEADQKYYAYEFWDNRLAGLFKGSDSLRLELRPGEAKMISIRQVADRPQLLSSDRHIMQGTIETRDIHWDPETLKLTGQVNLVQDEKMSLTFANNGYRLTGASVEGGVAALSADNRDQLCGVTMAADIPGWKRITTLWVKK